ncbi:MAG: FAD-binding dehydrogenase [Micrococcales bacterium 73-13]|nr:MAG: FAD-binding dehydrogenase [Micrococcales bacterium 73-13]
MDADAIVVGAGLAGLVAACELLDAGRRVLLVDQQGAQDLGGQAHWSFGGLFLVDTPSQRRLGVRDGLELAWQDWQGSAGWDRLGEGGADLWAARWGRAFVEWAAGEELAWLRAKGIRLTPMVGWAERGGGAATGHGNSVPRFHVAWGTGTGVSGPFADRVRQAIADGRLDHRPRHRVESLVVEAGAVVGVAGLVLAPDDSPRGAPSSREAVGSFELRAPAVLLATGGIGGDHDLVRSWWPPSLGAPPRSMLSGVPAYVDGSGILVAEAAGARTVNRDRMWHYTEGVRNFAPIWPRHGIRILPGPSSMWFDALGRRLPAPALPGYDTLATLRWLRTDPEIAGFDHSWFVLDQRIIEKEFALSGSEQNPDITSGSLLRVLRSRLGRGAPAPVEAFKRRGADFVVADSLDELVRGMNAIGDGAELTVAGLRSELAARDAELANPFAKDVQVQGIHNARRYRGDRLLRVARPHRILDPAHGPLIGVRLHVLTRKSLGGIQTDLESRALRPDGTPLPGLWAAGEAAGFGGGGLHGANALEGTFLGGCLFSGRAAGRSMAG